MKKHRENLKSEIKSINYYIFVVSKKKNSKTRRNKRRDQQRLTKKNADELNSWSASVDQVSNCIKINEKKN